MSDAILLYGDLNLNDNVTYFLVKEGFKYPSPALKQQYADSALKDGQLPTEAWKFDNRVLSFSIFVRGTDAATLDAALRALYMQVYAQDATVTWCPAGRSTSFYFLAYRPEAVAADSYFNTTRRSVNEAIVTWSGQGFPFGHTARQSLESTVLSASIVKLTAGLPTDLPQITVTGLSTGNAARLYDSTGSVYASAVESGGTATLTLKVDVMDYGATGDGVTDDTDAIQAAIEACPTGYTVYVPDGVYMIRNRAKAACVSYPCGLLAKDGLNMSLGDGATLKAIPEAISADSELWPWGAVLGIDSDSVTISGGTIEGDKGVFVPPTYKYSEWRTCISIFSATDVTISDITLRNAQGDGIYMMTPLAKENENITIDNVVSESNARQGIGVDSATNSIISNSTFDSNGLSGIDFEPLLVAEGGKRISGITLDGNVFSSNGEYGFIGGGDHSLISDILAENNEAFGNYAGMGVMNPGPPLVPMATNITFRNNYCHDNDQAVEISFKNVDNSVCESCRGLNGRIGFEFDNVTNTRISYNTSSGNSMLNEYFANTLTGTTCDHNVGITDR